MKTREEMIQTLARAEKYPTMDSWNRVYSLARNVKAYNLNLTDEQEDKLYKMLSGEVKTNVFQYLIDEYSAKLLEATNYEYVLGMNGRCGGYVVMYETEKVEDNYNYTVKLGAGFLDNYEYIEDYEEMEDEEVEQYYNILITFNKIVDDMLQELGKILDDCEIIEEDIETVVHVKSLYV